MPARIGATSYVFRYLLRHSERAPGLFDLIALAKSSGLDALQICENAHPSRASVNDWAELGKVAAQANLDLSLGCLTLDREVVVAYLDRVQAIGGSYLRIVLERDDATLLSIDSMRRFLDGIVPELEARSITLAIENHFHIPSRILVTVVETYSPDTVGFCVDVANSLRNFEDTDSVLTLLQSRAVCFHLKDYLLSGSDVGFSVAGAPFGEGCLDIDSLLHRVSHEGRFNKPIFLETWTASSGNIDEDIERDAHWLAASLRNLQAAVSAIGIR